MSLALLSAGIKLCVYAQTIILQGLLPPRIAFFADWASLFANLLECTPRTWEWHFLLRLRYTSTTRSQVGQRGSHVAESAAMSRPRLKLVAEWTARAPYIRPILKYLSYNIAAKIVDALASIIRMYPLTPLE